MVYFREVTFRDVSLGVMTQRRKAGLRFVRAGENPAAK